MKKVINIMIIALFCAMIILPTIMTNNKPDAISKRDNRRLSPLPWKEAHNGATFTEAANNYIDDRVGFRDDFITLNSAISYYVFKDSPNKNVIMGDNGWLFYNRENDGNTIPQYLGTARYTDEQLKQISKNLVETEKYLQDRGCEFVLFIAPNKERIYVENMPEKYRNMRVSGECCTEQLIEYLKKNTDIRVVWPYDDILKFKKEYPNIQTYYKLDTHWNQLGGYIGARALLKELKVDIPEPRPEKFTKSKLKYGDLKKMMALDNLEMEDVDYLSPNYPSKTSYFIDKGLRNSWTYKSQDKDTRRILMSEDSFSIAMQSIIGSSFNYVDMQFKQNLNKKMIATEKPDVFVYETAERYEDDLLDFSLKEK